MTDGTKDDTITITAPTIEPRIAQNLIAFLQRVQVTGPEAIAWCEANAALQQFAPPQQPGVPFAGLPQK